MNGNSNNGNGNGKKEGKADITVAGKNAVTPAANNNQLDFYNLHPDRSVVFKQPANLSRAVIWTLMIATTGAIVWATVARLEQVVGATGQLKPQGKVQEVQAPLNGVVKEVLVKEGDRVKKGQTLVLMDSASSKAQLESLQKIRRTLEQENKFYRLLISRNLDTEEVESSLSGLNLPMEVATLARNRASLVGENELFEVQLGESNAGLNASERSRLSASRNEADSRSAAARLEIEQLQEQLKQTRVQLEDARTQLITDKNSLEEIRTRNENTLKELQAGLEIDEKILADMEPLGEQGAVARYQINKQKQAVTDRKNNLLQQQANGKVELDRQSNQVQTRTAEISRLEKEANRYELLIAQARKRSSNTDYSTEKDLRDRIADNQKRIAEIDSQLGRIIVDNDKRIAELDSQISQADQTLKYQKLTAPIDGVVFDLKARPGFVPQPAQAEALLKIVPDGCPSEVNTVNKGCLIAEVDVTNEDIGFVRVGQKADVRIDSFAYSEYGDIKGEVISIGSDALPPDQEHRFYRFPVKIRMNTQELVLRDKSALDLQSGMSVTVNIKVNENRTVLSLFTDLFNKQVDTLKQVR